MIFDYTQLGNWISAQASEHFKRWYSSDTNDYIDDIKEEYSRTIIRHSESKSLVYDCHIELTQAGAIPLVLRFEKYVILTLQDELIDEYYRI